MGYSPMEELIYTQNSLTNPCYLMVNSSRLVFIIYNVATAVPDTSGLNLR